MRWQCYICFKYKYLFRPSAPAPIILCLPALFKVCLASMSDLYAFVRVYKYCISDKKPAIYTDKFILKIVFIGLCTVARRFLILQPRFPFLIFLWVRAPASAFVLITWSKGYGKFPVPRMHPADHCSRFRDPRKTQGRYRLFCLRSSCMNDHILELYLLLCRIGMHLQAAWATF